MMPMLILYLSQRCVSITRSNGNLLPLTMQAIIPIVVYKILDKHTYLLKHNVDIIYTIRRRSVQNVSYHSVD